jgi:excisionase family DNA binding protein
VDVLKEIPMLNESPLTISVPEAGKKYYGLSRDGSYRAAERGEIPTIRVGRLLRVPVRAMERLLDTAIERKPVQN